jgi:ubiquinone/menaquinone biosynthesis C-methylase UbiE
MFAMWEACIAHVTISDNTILNRASFMAQNQRQQHYYTAEIAALYTSDHKTRQRWINTVRGYLHPPYGRVLDIGSGDGTSSLPLADQADLLVEVDISLPMLMRGKTRAQAEDIHNAAFVAADMARLPFKAGTFDAAISASALHHLPLDDTLPAIRQVLCGGGRLVISDFARRHAWEKSRILYILHHLLHIPGRIRRRGLRETLRSARLKLSPEWIADFFSDYRLTPEEHVAQYRRHLPGCNLDDRGKDIVATWEAPHSTIGGEARSTVV